jgi:hypothetical protein
MSDEVMVCVIILIGALLLVIGQLAMFLLILWEGKDDKRKGRNE